jgi:hypothetical protein
MCRWWPVHGVACTLMESRVAGEACAPGEELWRKTPPGTRGGLGEVAAVLCWPCAHGARRVGRSARLQATEVTAAEHPSPWSPTEERGIEEEAAGRVPMWG